MVRCEFRKGGALALVAEDCEGAMALKYWHKENQEHAGKLIEIDTSVMDGDSEAEAVEVAESNPGPRTVRR